MGRNFSLKSHQVAQAVALYARGLPMSRIGEIYGVATDCVKRAFIARGIKIRNQSEQAAFIPMTLERLKLNCTVTKTECWIWGGKPTVNGYCRTNIAGKSHYIHRIAYELHTGIKPKSNIDIRQECGDRRCCNPEHLVAGTRKTTIAHARLSRGILHSMAVKRGQARSIHQQKGIT